MERIDENNSNEERLFRDLWEDETQRGVVLDCLKADLLPPATLVLLQTATGRPRPRGKCMWHKPLALADARPSSWAAQRRRRSW